MKPWIQIIMVLILGSISFSIGSYIGKQCADNDKRRHKYEQ